MRLHKGLKPKEWFKKTMVEQMANVGAEIERALDAWGGNEEDRGLAAFYRALELLQYTKIDPKNKNRLKELCRLYEILGEYFLGNNQYRLTEEWIRQYFRFFYFAWVSERKPKKGKSKT